MVAGDAGRECSSVRARVFKWGHKLGQGDVLGMKTVEHMLIRV